jgi:hypothetical protein
MPMTARMLVRKTSEKKKKKEKRTLERDVV